MKQRVRLAVTGAAALVAGALISAPAHASTGSGAVLVQTDNLSGNSVAVYDRNPDGSLTAAGTYATGGLGGALAGSVVDHLASQGSLTLDRAHSLLYAVNAGSNTITVFGVHGDTLARRQVIGSGGAFPVSVTTHGSAVFVLNARDGGSVQGFRLAGGRLVRIPAWHRTLGLDATATPEFTHTPGQVAFSPDGAHLVVTTKSNGSDIDVFGIGASGAPSASPVVNADPGAVPFAVSYDVWGHLLVAEAGTNSVSTFAIGSSGDLTRLSTAATGQAATCWIVGTGRSFYASNAGSATLSGYAADGSGALTAIGLASTDAGTVDAAIGSDQRFLYAQAGAAGNVDAFAINSDGSLTAVSSVTVPGAAGGEGIVAQ